MADSSQDSREPAGAAQPPAAPDAAKQDRGGQDEVPSNTNQIEANHRAHTGASPAHSGQLNTGPPPSTPPSATPLARAATARQGQYGKRAAAVVALAVVAALIGGGVGAVVGRETASSTFVGTPGSGTLAEPTPPAGDLAPAAVTQVAARVVPSVVQLSGAAGEGSGVVLSADGLIMTNAHVLAAAGNNRGLTATFQNGTRAPVSVIGSDTRADIAVVRAQGVSGLTPIQLGNSDELQVGQQVVAVGSPLGLSETVTTGIVSALNRPVVTQQPQQQAPQNGPGDLGGLGGFGGLEGSGGLGGFGGLAPGQPAQISALDAIQTDAAINPGNSGGPLVDMQGRIVGLNSAIASLGAQAGGQSGSIGLGFSIPINQAKRIADELIASGHAEQAQLGATVTDHPSTGAQIVAVQPNSAAAKAGLAPGDVITKVDTQLIEDADSLVAAINSQPPNRRVTLTITHGAGNPRTISVTLASVTAT